MKPSSPKQLVASTTREALTEGSATSAVAFLQHMRTAEVGAFCFAWIGGGWGVSHRGGKPIGSIGFSVSCWVKTDPQLLSLQVEVNVFHYCAAMSVCTSLGCHFFLTKVDLKGWLIMKKVIQDLTCMLHVDTHLKIQNHTNTSGIDAKYHLLFRSCVRPGWCTSERGVYFRPSDSVFLRKLAFCQRNHGQFLALSNASPAQRLIALSYFNNSARGYWMLLMHLLLAGFSNKLPKKKPKRHLNRKKNKLKLHTPKNP